MHLDESGVGEDEEGHCDTECELFYLESRKRRCIVSKSILKIRSEKGKSAITIHL
jgi:hypothetical protein